MWKFGKNSVCFWTFDMDDFIPTNRKFTQIIVIISIITFITLNNSMKTQKESAKITVVIRKRPLNKKEQQKGETDIIKVEDQGSIVVS